MYDQLSKEDKEAFEDTFENEDGKVPERIDSSALNTWIFNEDTIRRSRKPDERRVKVGENILIFVVNRPVGLITDHQVKWLPGQGRPEP